LRLSLRSHSVRTHFSERHFPTGPVQLILYIGKPVVGNELEKVHFVGW
jgi:hypothetical protein